MKLDDLHYTTRNIDGYNKPFNFIISAREAGKSTYITLKKVYEQFKKDKSTFIYLKRLNVDITDMYIDSLLGIIDKFYPEDNCRFRYKKGDLNCGMVEVDISINNSEYEPFIWCIALGVKLQRVKSLMLPRLKYIIFDEFIVNNLLGEKYLFNETFKFKELFKTFQRENRQLKCYFLGNPYSKYNPYFTEFNIPLSKIKRGTIISNDKAVVENYELKPELLEYIKEHDPLYNYEDPYIKYAYEGESVNDQNIYLVDKQPENYQLNTIFKVQNTYINIFCGNNSDYNYWVSVTKNSIVGKRRNVYCINFSDLDGQCSYLYNIKGFDMWQSLRLALMSRQVAFKDLEAYYMMEAIYPKL